MTQKLQGPDGKIVIYNKEGNVENEYPINWGERRGGSQIFLLATDKAGPGGTTRCIAQCSKGFLVHALAYHAERYTWLRDVLSSTTKGSGFLGWLKSSQGCFMLGMYTMVGCYLCIEGFRDGHMGIAVVGAMLAGLCFCAHHFLPAQKEPKEEK